MKKNEALFVSPELMDVLEGGEDALLPANEATMTDLQLRYSHRMFQLHAASAELELATRARANRSSPEGAEIPALRARCEELKRKVERLTGRAFGQAPEAQREELTTVLGLDLYLALEHEYQGIEPSFSARKLRGFAIATEVRALAAEQELSRRERRHIGMVTPPILAEWEATVRSRLARMGELRKEVDELTDGGRIPLFSDPAEA